MKRARVQRLVWLPVPDDAAPPSASASASVSTSITTAYDALATSRISHDEWEESRRACPVFPLRAFNNGIKSSLIRRAAQFISTPQFTVLELCIGQGGDIAKWFAAGAAAVVGCDISPASIDRARDRVGTRKVSLFVVDLAHDGVHLLDLLKGEPCRVVSCQMALHYLFADEASGVRLFGQIAQCLERGGVFVASMPSAEAIVRLNRHVYGVNRWGNDFYSIGMTTEVGGGPRSYEFWLLDCVGTRETGVREYLVPFPALLRVARMSGLELVSRDRFAATDSAGFASLCPALREIAGLYQTLLFMRV